MKPGRELDALTEYDSHYPLLMGRLPGGVLVGGILLE